MPKKLLKLFERKTYRNDAPVWFDPRMNIPKSDGDIYICVTFQDNAGRDLHNVVVTARELQDGFYGYDAVAVVTGYMSEADALALTLEERGLHPAPLVRPTNVCPDIWDSLNPKQQEFVIEHERLHQELRDKNAAAKAAVKAVYDALCK